MPHRTGSQPHRQLLYEMDEIVEIIKLNPSLPPIEVVERSFGRQKHSNVFSFGGGMRRKHLKDSRTAYIKDLEVKLRETEQENINYKRCMDSLESRIAQIENNNKTDADLSPTRESSFEQET